MVKIFDCRQLFEGEQARLSRKYGRYCINNSRSSIIVDQNIQFFSSYQFTNNLELRVDAMLIKPIQRLTRWLQKYIIYLKIFVCYWNIVTS